MVLEPSAWRKRQRNLDSGDRRVSQIASPLFRWNHSRLLGVSNHSSTREEGLERGLALWSLVGGSFGITSVFVFKYLALTEYPRNGRFQPSSLLQALAN